MSLVSTKPGDLKKVPYAKLTPDFVWDAGTADEKIMPNLEWLWVPPSMRNQGIGLKLIRELLKVMKKHKIPKLMFVDHASGFWKEMASKFKEVKITGRIGYITLKK